MAGPPTSAPHQHDLARAAALIAAYQATLREAESLAPEARALVVHVVAESCEKAAADTARLRSEEIAVSLKSYRAQLGDPLGTVLDAVRDEGIGQLRDAALGLGSAIASAKATLTAALGAFATAGWTLFTVGFAMGNTPHGIRAMAWLVFAVPGYKAAEWMEDRQRQLAAAFSVAKPIWPLLSRTLDDAESMYFTELSSTPPSRPTLPAAGPMYGLGLGLVYALALASVAFVVGGFAWALIGESLWNAWNTSQEASESSSDGQ